MRLRLQSAGFRPGNNIMTQLEIPVRVYIEDTDAGGIVYYVNYLKFMERARTEFLRRLGYGKAALFADDKMFVVHSLRANYHQSAELDDELVATATIKKVSRVTVLFEQKILRAGELLCDGEVKVACVSRQKRKPAAIPEDLLQRINPEELPD